MKTHPSALQTLLALLLLFRLDIQGAVVFSDTFSTGTAGDVIHNTAVETGTGTWQGHGFYEYSGGTVIWDTANSNSINIHTRVGHVAVNNGSTISGSLSSISSTIRNPFANADPTVWTGIGYVNNPLNVFDSSLFTAGVDELWMLLRNNGEYQIIANTLPADTVLATGTASVFNDGVGDSGYNDLRLDYNQAANTLSASINSVNVLNNFNLTPSGYTSSSITAVGFQLFRHEGAAVDSFSFQSSAVPEPSRALLAALGLCGLILRRRR